MSLSKGHILCLEDDPDTCELATLLLQADGYEVTSAATIADARRLITENSSALYIVDERLPDGDGLDFIREVRAAGNETPILVHSANAYQRDIDEAIEAGANDYLVKPGGWTRICKLIDSMLQ